MNTWPVPTAQHAVLAPRLTAGAVPAAEPIGGFAVGALSSAPSASPDAPRPVGPQVQSAPPLPRRVPGREYPGLGHLSMHGPAEPGMPGTDESEPGEGEQASQQEAGPDLSPRRSDGRPKPRHAAPGASFGRRMSRLLSIRLLASGAHI